MLIISVQLRKGAEGEMNKLFSNNFILLILGQISSLFANTILRFALSVYILELTGSASIFAGLLALAMVPTILLSPFGGILADRANRRNIMVTLDFLSGITATIAVLTINESNAVVVVGSVLVILSVLSAFESPTVQAAAVQMQEGDNVIRANAVVNQVAALASLVAPFLGSACYTAFGLKPVLAASVFSFFITALLEEFIRLPYVRERFHAGWKEVVKHDFRLSIHFLVREKPGILRLLLSVAVIGCFIMGIGNVGLPYMIRVSLGLSAEYVGIAESVCGAAAIVGSIVVGVAAKRLKASGMYRFLIGVGGCMIPMGLSFLLGNVMVIYWSLLLFIAIMQVLASIFSIYCLSLIQQQTPNELLGKVMAYIATITLCLQPIGQIVYGMLFDALTNNVLWIMIGTALCVILVSVAARKTFEGIEGLEGTKS